MAKRFSPEFQLESAKLVLDQNYTPTEAANAMNVGVSTMKPMTIISLKHQLSQFFSPDFMIRTARRTGFLKRERTIEPQALVLSLIAALSKGNCHAIAVI